MISGIFEPLKALKYHEKLCELNSGAIATLYGGD
jgi:hypothetical protein